MQVESFNTGLEIVSRFDQPIHQRLDRRGLSRNGQSSMDLFDAQRHPVGGRMGSHVVSIELTPIGSQRRDWKRTLVGDGIVMARHPDLQSMMQIAGKVAGRFQVIAS